MLSPGLSYLPHSCKAPYSSQCSMKFSVCTSYYYSPCSSSFSQTPEVWSHGGTLGSVVCWILKGELPRFPEFFICLVLFSLQILCLETQVALVPMVSQLGLLNARAPQCSAWVSPLCTAAGNSISAIHWVNCKTVLFPVSQKLLFLVWWPVDCNTFFHTFSPI